MTALLDRVSLRGEAARDVLAVWLTITAALTYLDVPLQHAPLFAINLVLQASLGVAVITYLLKGVAPSLLLLCGPGLILGGALSFAIFQVAGRGVIGVVTTIAVGVAATTHLLVSREPYETSAPRWWLLGQMVGMAMLAIATEFTELLPVAGGLFLLGFINSVNARCPQWLRALLNIAVLAAICVLVPLRAEFWWLVTDDYQLLEVISNHLASAGPFATWGVESFSRYHWLSYGWSGLLDVASGNAAPLVTLTRVMPFVYSVSMASSVIMLLHKLLRHDLLMWVLLPAWFVIAIGRFDWTGTSTGGAYSTIAALVLIAVVVTQSRSQCVKSLAIIFLFTLIVALTKFPSVFTIITLGFTYISTYTALEYRHFLIRWTVIGVGSLATTLIVVAGVWTFGKLLDERIRFVSINPALGQLSALGRSFAGAVLVLNQLWLWFMLVVLAASFFRSRQRNSEISWLASFAATTLGLGLIFELSLTGGTNSHTYFSNTMYFVASFAALLLPIRPSDSQTRTRISSIAFLVTVLLIGLTWSFDDIAVTVWGAILNPLADSPELKIELLRFFTLDSRFGAVIGSVIVGVIFSRALRREQIFGMATLALVCLTFLNLIDQSYTDFSRRVPSSEVEAYFGSGDEIRVGLWLKQNSGASDLVATNLLYGDNGGSVSDLALAVWSEREFFVLGPSLGYRSSQARTDAMALSTEFAKSPTAELCDELMSRSVDWFVVDMSTVESMEWPKCASPRYSYEQLTVLSLSARDQ